MIAASDEMDENHFNINLVVSKLKLWELEDLDWILSGDQKFANICFGVQCHTCHHNCIYCEGCKMDENGNKTNSVEADWFPGGVQDARHQQVQADTLGVCVWPSQG